MMKYLGYVLGLLSIGLGTLGINSAVQAQILDRPDFFEQGSEQLEQEIRRLQRKPSDEVLTLPALEPEKWKKVSSPDERVTVFMPIEGDCWENNEIVEISLGSLEFEEAICSLNQTKYALSYSDTLSPEMIENPDRLFSALTDFVLENYYVELLQENEVQYRDSNLMGKEVMLRDERESSIVRFYLVRDRLYVLAASFDPQGPTPPDVPIFFNSLIIQTQED